MDEVFTMFSTMFFSRRDASINTSSCGGGRMVTEFDFHGIPCAFLFVFEFCEGGVLNFCGFVFEC